MCLLKVHTVHGELNKWNAQHVLLSLLPVYSQPIICKAGADLLRSHFLPTLDKLRKKTIKVRVSSTPCMAIEENAQFLLQLRFILTTKT